MKAGAWLRWGLSLIALTVAGSATADKKATIQC
jgi:hypothetical protein